MSSWKALSWAKDQTAGSPLAKLVLLLLAERADERFSCYPGRKTLAAEAEATERGVKLVLRQLEARGLLTTVAQKRPNGSQTSNRYYLNHPEAPHVHAVAQVGGGELSARGGGTQCPGGGNSVPGGGELSAPPGGELSSPPELPRKNLPPNPEAAEDERRAEKLLAELPPPWVVAAGQRRKLVPLVRAALAAGWAEKALREHLSANPDGVRNAGAVLFTRLNDLPDAPRQRQAAPRPTWCGQCDERTRQISTDDDRVARCPACHPATAQKAPRTSETP